MSVVTVVVVVVVSVVVSVVVPVIVIVTAVRVVAARVVAGHHTRSMIVAMPMPPPMQSVMRAVDLFVRSSSSSAVPMRHAPVAPSG